MNNKNGGAGNDGLSWLVGAGIVGADIGTSVFYSTGLLFNYVGYLTPLFILFVCLMMWAFKRTYEEGMALSPHNGGAYTMILRSIGRRTSVLAGTLTVLTYLATAAVSALSGAFYLSALGSFVPIHQVVLIAAVPIIIFGILNTKGIKEPAKIVTAITCLHFGLLMLIILLSLGFIIFKWSDVDFSKMSKITVDSNLTFAMFIHGFAGAFLGITGFESAAQIFEELKSPALKTLRKLYKTVIILVSITAPLISFMCLSILSEQEIIEGKEFLIASLGAKIGGSFLKHVVVFDATLTLFAAVNTAFVGFIGLAVTMAKQGNLPQKLLIRWDNRYPWIEGYPYIALPFMGLALFMIAVLPGRVDTLAKVYEMAFLCVMCSFCMGVILMRNKKQENKARKIFLTNSFVFLNKKIPIIPTVSFLVLSVAFLTLVVFSSNEAKVLGLWMFCLIVLTMTFYRWGVLESRLEKKADFGLGLGVYKHSEIENISTDMPKYVVCIGATTPRRLITRAIDYAIEENQSKPFEMILFHVDELGEGFVYSALQRVILQQIMPVYKDKDIVITLKTLPDELIEGLQTLNRTNKINKIMIGRSGTLEGSQRLAKEIYKELKIEVVRL